jgi:hypothetical protein
MIIINFTIKMNLINKGFLKLHNFKENYELERRGKNEKKTLYIYGYTRYLIP